MKGFTKWIGKYLPFSQHTEPSSAHQTDQPGVRYYSGLEIKRLQDAAYHTGLYDAPEGMELLTKPELHRREHYWLHHAPPGYRLMTEAELSRHDEQLRKQELDHARRVEQAIFDKWKQENICPQHGRLRVYDEGKLVCPQQPEHSEVVRRETPRPTTNLNVPVSHLSRKPGEVHAASWLNYDNAPTEQRRRVQP